MKIKVNIEETVVQTFEIAVPEDVDPYDFIRDGYYKSNIVLGPENVNFEKWKSII